MTRPVRVGDGLIRLSEGRPPRVRIVALSHAGGGPSSLRRLATFLPDDVDYWAVCLQGRESRWREAPLSCLYEAASQVASDIESFDDGVRLILQGHSFGARLAWEVAHRLTERDGLIGLVASGRTRPCEAGPPPPRDGDELRHWLADAGGTDPRVLECDELLETVLPALRADLGMNCQPLTCRVVNVPVLLMSAAGDRMVAADRVRSWRCCVGGSVSFESMAGGHFHLQQRPREAADVIAAFCRRLTTAAAGAPAYQSAGRT